MEDRPKEILAALSLASVGCFGLGGLDAGFGATYFAGLAMVACHYAWQINSLNIADRERCWNLF